ncbi:MAG: amidohydrolase family protein [Candidatus Obscuribacterales bacterium]|nr:amidohydrolase family protein [Candidatus Obscuribacterales bacterium]
MSPTRYLLARWILPINSPPVENGCLVIGQNKIEKIITRQEYEALEIRGKLESSKDYGDAVILPGLVNLHTHLDYSALKHFDTASPFFGWIRGLIGNSWQWTAEQWQDSALIGAREIALSGTSCVVDSSYSGAAAYGIARMGLRGIVGLEIFGIAEEKADQAWQLWQAKYEAFHNNADEHVRRAFAESRLLITVAPHTPYSVCPALMKKTLEWSREKGLPLLLHIAESEMECKWIAGPEPDVDKFLLEATREDVPGGIASLSWRGHGLTPVEHLAKYELLADNILAAHLVKVSDSDLELLRQYKLSGAHCPRSNSRLRNGVAPFPKLAGSGMEMGFGTDSSASTDDLNVLQEACFAWDLHRAVNPEFNFTSEQALYYLTLGAAKAAGLACEIGSLQSGKLADIAVFDLSSLPEIARSKPSDSLLYGPRRLRDLYVNGAMIVQEGQLVANSPLPV